MNFLLMISLKGLKWTDGRTKDYYSFTPAVLILNKSRICGTSVLETVFRSVIILGILASMVYDIFITHQAFSLMNGMFSKCSA